MGATQKEHRLLKQLLSDSIVRVCETSLGHSGCFSVDALVGVQLGDGRVFIVNLHKSHSATKLVNTASADDDDVTSLDMHVDEIADVKQEPSTETAGQIGGERRSERLKKKRTVSRKSGSSKSAAKSSRKKLALAGGTRRARQTTDTFEKLQDVGDLTNCATSVGADVKHSEYNNYLNDDIDRATSPRDRSSTAPDDGTSDGTSERAIAELTSDELSRYDIDVGRNRRGTEGTDGDVAVVSDDVVKWTCHVCGYSSAHRNNFERHLFLHNLTPDGKSHMCSECGKRCRDAHELRTHVSVKHRKLLFRCARCGDGGKAFQSQKALRYHVATKHTGEFRYRCAVCDKTFLYVAHYRTHMNVHDGVRQLCAYCGKQFNYRASLKKHMDACEARRHDTATPPPVDFRCEHCDRTFRSRSYLTDHVHTRHLRTRRYACTACGAAFLYRTGLARHRAKCANSAPGDGLGASGDGSELAARSQEEATFVDLMADVGTDVGLISAALRYVSHNTGQLTTHDDVTTTLDVPAAVTSLSTTASVGVTSPDDLLSTTVNQTVASPDDVLITTAAMTMTSPDDVLSTTVAQTVASPGDLLSTTAGQTVTSPDDVLSTTVAQTVASPDDMLSAESLQYVTAVCCQPTERQCTAETCVEALQQCSVTQLFDSCSDSTLRTLHLGGVASSHQDGVASAMTVAPPGNNIG